jgi:cytochrome P450
MNETLRLYPVVPFNVRLSLKDTTLPHGGGPDGLSPMGILKDTPIGYSPLLMQRRADLFPSTPSLSHLEFSPERWQTWQPKPWQYIPFNGGPRVWYVLGGHFSSCSRMSQEELLLRHFSGATTPKPSQKK